jgi:hypothetical protein
VSNSTGTWLDAGGIQARSRFFLRLIPLSILVPGGVSILSPPSSRPPPQNIQACLLVHFGYPNLLLIPFIRYQGRGAGYRRRQDIYGRGHGEPHAQKL